jgi:hypothetical protein
MKISIDLLQCRCRWRRNLTSKEALMHMVSRFWWLTILLLVAGCGDRMAYSARVLHADPGARAIPPGASVAVIVEGTNPGDIPDPESAGERLIRVLAGRGHPVRRAGVDELETCGEDRALVLASEPEGPRKGAEVYTVHARVLECRSQKELARLRFRLEPEGRSIAGPGPSDLVVGRTLSWLAVPGPHEPERVVLPRYGGLFFQSGNAFALYTKKKIQQDIPYYRPKTDWDVLSVQSYAFGLDSTFLDTRLEYSYGIEILDQLGGPDGAGFGLFLGLEYVLGPRAPWNFTVWGQGTAAIFSHTGESGTLLRATAGGGLHWTPLEWLRLHVRAGLGGQWIDTADVDVTWDRPREIRLDSLVVVLTAGVSLSW